MSDLIVTIAVDFSGGDWFADHAGRIAATMLLGKAGDVRFAGVPGAWLAARSARRSAPGQSLRSRRFAPHRSASGAYTLLAGRIAERDDLLQRLGIHSDITDHAALYAAAYDRFGDDCDRHVTGDYAAIMWFPEQRRLRLARSPVCNQPLHVWRERERLVVSSIPRAIFATGVESRIDDTKLVDSLLINLMDGRDNWYAGLSRVAYASVAWHDRDGGAQREYWRIDDCPPVRFARDTDYVEAVDECFRRATRASLEDGASPAILLSGGFDSQAVASYAVEQLGAGRPLRSYTSVPMAGWTPSGRPHAIENEADHVRALARMYPTIEPTFVDGADKRFGERLDEMFLLGSWPTHNEMGMHWLHEAYGLAAQAGCEVMLVGDMGNTGFSYDGQTGFPTWFRQGNWLRLANEIRLSGDPRPFWRRLVSLAIWPNAPMLLRRLRDIRNPRRLSPFSSWSPLRKDCALTRAAIARAEAGGSDLHEYDFASAAEWREHVFRTLAGNVPEIRLGLHLAHGVETRDPTAFLPLLELCAGIPDDQYLRRGVDRWLGRRLLRGRVPEMVHAERRYGRQTADWPMRFAKDREAMLADMASLRRDPRLAAIFDFDRMIRELRDWDGSDEPSKRYYYRINACIGRGLSTARFVRHAEGRNAG